MFLASTFKFFKLLVVGRYKEYASIREEHATFCACFFC